MNITFNEHTFEVTTKNEGGEILYSLKDIENGWKESKPEGASAKDLRHWKRSKDVVELISLCVYRTVNVREGSKTTTYGCKKAVEAYVDYCIQGSNPSPSKSTGLYCIKMEEHNLYKFGVAGKVSQRLKHLQAGNPFELTVVKFFECPSHFELEGLVHSMLKQYHKRGEWFELDNDMLTKTLTFIEELMEDKDNTQQVAN